MDGFVACPACSLRYRIRADGLCPRCKTSAHGPSSPVSALAVDAPEREIVPGGRPRFFAGAILRGCALDVFGTMIVGGILGASFGLKPDSAVLYVVSCTIGILAAWRIGRGSENHELANALAGSALTLGVAFVFVGIPKTLVDAVGYILVPPLYAVGGLIARRQRQYEEQSPEHIAFKERLTAESTVMGSEWNMSGTIIRAVIYGVVVVVIRALLTVARHH